MNIPSEKMPGYKHRDVQNRVSITPQELNMGDFATIMSLVNQMLWKLVL